MKISVVTPSYNQGRFIRDTIESVLCQNHDDIEHIIVDGGSTDNTISILKEYSHLKWISETDNGPIDAINKGFKMASGEIIAWINSDDFFEENVFGDVVTAFTEKGVKIVNGFMNLVDVNKKNLWVNQEVKDYRLDYLVKVNTDIIRQPSTFFLKSLYYEVGGLDETLELVFDVDLFIKMFSRSKPKILTKVLSSQRIYDQTLTRKSLRKQALEIYRMTRKYGATYKDRINRLIVKRYLFPSLWSSKKSMTVKLVRLIKKDFN